MIKSKHLWVLVLTLWFVPAKASVVINEIMASNKKTLTDNKGQTSDWLELYNSGEEAVSLEGWFLSDDVENPMKFKLPAVNIGPKSFLIIFASGEGAVLADEIHTNFKLSAKGENLLLSDAVSSRIDQYTFGEMEEDESIGRRMDGGAVWGKLASASPGFSNQEGASEVYITSSHPAGIYKSSIKLYLEASEEGFEIRYTLDGSRPTASSPLFDGTLPLNDKVDRLPDISLIPTSWAWQLPEGEIQQYHIVRARAFRCHQASGALFEAIYMIDPKGGDRYSYPVVSIIKDKEGLFSPERGIFVEGNDINYRKKGREWEVPIHLDYFDEKGDLGFSQKLGLRISGNSSVEYPQKSFKFFARSEYGQSHLEYPFFGEDYDDSFKRLSFRSLNADWSNVGLSDDLAQQLVHGVVDFEYARRRFVIVFINGEYWGIHSMRDAHDEEFVSRKADLPKKEICMGLAKINSEESLQECMKPYHEMFEFVQNNDLNILENYERVAAEFDLNSLMEITTTQLFLSNVDWPHHNNRFWRSSEEGSRWRWIFYDLDAAFKSVLNDNLGLLFQAEFDYSSFPDPIDYQLILALMKTDRFRDAFRNKMYEMIDRQFAPTRTIPILDAMVDDMEPELEEHIQRWNYPHNLKAWKRDIEMVRQFLINRPNYLRADIYNRLDFPLKYYPNPTREVLQLQIEVNKEQELQIDLVDASSRVFPLSKRSLVLGNNEWSEKLPADLPSGLYYLRMRSPYHHFSKPLTIVR